jgi:hypothetical protein
MSAETVPTLEQILARYMNNLYGTRDRVVPVVKRLLAEAWDEGYAKGNLDGCFGISDEWAKNPHGIAHRDGDA